ncbi:hypothetical protein B0H17DRAFT_1124226 [Mycena rosella]|uniref:Uncharacterized protein n=1 Tax=Mycena rosella TaxID=1033263 RepID=A0AAD7H1F0_MYCRO|nr:hypothetical protein B0H17DRAFT_1124226 [Mycena rosella]
MAKNNKNKKNKRKSDPASDYAQSGQLNDAQQGSSQPPGDPGRDAAVSLQESSNKIGHDAPIAEAAAQAQYKSTNAATTSGKGKSAAKAASKDQRATVEEVSDDEDVRPHESAPQSRPGRVSIEFVHAVIPPSLPAQRTEKSAPKSVSNGSARSSVLPSSSPYPVSTGSPVLVNLESALARSRGQMSKGKERRDRADSIESAELREAAARSLADMPAESSKAAEAATQPLSARLSAPKADIRRDHVARNTNPSMSRPNHHFTRTPGVQFANCVVPPPPGLMDEVDAKGFPADVETWNTHWRLVKTGQPYWVLAHRCFFIYVFARDMPAEDRTIVQQLALEEFYMMDWYCDMLRKLAGVKDATNAEKHRLMSLKRDDLPYDPKTRALLMQLREVHDVAGCGFVDKCWTLDMCLVRGLALLEALSLGNRGDKTEPYRSIRVRLEKLFIELFATPRLYRTRLHERRLTPATFFTPMHWDPLTAANATMDTVVSSFAHMGVSEAMVDDAFKFGQKWLHDWTYRPVAPPGWTADEVSGLISATAGGKEPAGFFRKEDDLFPRPPTLAWASSADNVIAFQLSHLQHSELSGMRRQPNSVFQKQLDAGLKLYPHENRNVLRLANPFLAENKARVQQSRNTTTAPSGPSTYISGKRRGKARVNPRPVAPGPTQLGQGIHPSMIMPDSFTTTQPIVFFDPNTTAANSALSFQSSNLEFSPFGSAYFNSPDNEI